jgi:hypothetical protein
MAAVLGNFLSGLTPPPYVNPVEYDGWQYKRGYMVFRPALLKRELAIVAAFLFYVVVYFVGKSQNVRRATTWLDAHLPVLTTQFSKPTNGGLTHDGASDAFNFSTGRRGVTSLHSVFRFRPRHDLIQQAFHFGRSLVDVHYRQVDSLELDFRLAPGAAVPECVFAIVAKDELPSIKDDRWDLTFTRTTENPQLPSSLSVMSEFADVTENLLKPAIVAAISDPAVLPYFRSLTLTDQPRERPSTGPAEREKHVILSLIAPPAHAASATKSLVSALFPFIDSLPRVTLRPETKTKLRKTREELDRDLKEEANREKTEEAAQALEDKKAAKKRAEDERVSRLSAVEQQKIAEKERKRLLRKQQGKVVRK